MRACCAIIKPVKLGEGHSALTDIGLQGMTATEVKGFGRQKGHAEIYRGAGYTTAFPAEGEDRDRRATDKAVDAIIRSAKIGQIGDDKTFISPVDRAVRVRR